MRKFTRRAGFLAAACAPAAKLLGFRPSSFRCVASMDSDCQPGLQLHRVTERPPDDFGRESEIAVIDGRWPVMKDDAFRKQGGAWRSVPKYGIIVSMGEGLFLMEGAADAGDQP